ncbi:MAG: hypothetical protein ACOZFS_00235 [Thermodesulfobacteriota bacterium]
MTVLLDDEFLRSLGIREGCLPRWSAPTKEPVTGVGQNLPMAEDKPVPPEVLDLTPEELEKLIKEDHSEENPYVFLMPGGRHTAAVYPGDTKELPETMDKYDMVLKANQFMNMVDLCKTGQKKFMGYKTRTGEWFDLKGGILECLKI